MSADFADSNVLIYLTSGDKLKAAMARSVLIERPVVSVQVLNETVNVLRRKLRRSWPETLELLDEVRQFVDVIPLTEAMHRDALRLAVRYRLQWWDALIVAAAMGARCSRVLTEDFHAGIVIDGRLTIVNPFAQDPR